MNISNRKNETEKSAELRPRRKRLEQKPLFEFDRSLSNRFQAAMKSIISVKIINAQRRSVFQPRRRKRILLDERKIVTSLRGTKSLFQFSIFNTNFNAILFRQYHFFFCGRISPKKKHFSDDKKMNEFI